MCVLGPLSHQLLSPVQEEEHVDLVEETSHLFNSSLLLIFPDNDKPPHPHTSPGLDSQEPMASDKAKPCELNQDKYDADDNVKIICLGDSAVGKSKLMERFLMDGFQPQQLSTYALTLYKHTATVDGKTVLVDFWDTAGQERFQSMHASYYHKAHACIMVFDVQRKVTYKNLSTWYTELREFRPEIPCIVVANKIDADVKMTQKSFNFARKFSLPLYFVSAADGTNVVKLFNDAIRLAVSYKHNSQDFMDEVLQELENFDLEQTEEEVPDQAQRGNTESPSPS
ncbi:rab-like protein 2B isoform X1 [Neovison vison]|nr:rab-like protein 2B isoform X1 [Neogale vison]